MPRGRGMATAALVCGIASIVLFFVFVVGAVALVLGLIAASQIKQGPLPHDGLGRARAGWILGTIATVLFAGIVVAAATGVLDDDVAVGDLDVGDCLDFDPDEVEGTEIGRLPRSRCDEPHSAEVYLVDDLDDVGDEFPGDGELGPLIQRRCAEQFADYLDPTLDQDDFGVFYLQPSESSWRAGDREFVCMITTSSGSTISRGVAADE